MVLFSLETQGYKYRLKAVYAHFPINVAVNNHTDVEIRNFLGEKIVRKIKMLPGVKCGIVAGAKDEIEVYVCSRSRGFRPLLFSWFVW